MRRVSPKRARESRALAPALDAYRAEFPVCQVPRCKNLASEIHELVRGPSRIKARAERACVLALCAPCHRDLHAGGVPLVVQIAWKLLADPEGYDLATVLRVKGLAEGAVEQEEVDRVVRSLTKEIGR